jgi:hypothetical protein
MRYNCSSFNDVLPPPGDANLSLSIAYQASTALRAGVAVVLL